MTTLTTPVATTTRIAPQRFSALTRVEIWKMISTRSGLGVLGAVLFIVLAGTTWELFNTATRPPSWQEYSGLLTAAGMAIAMIGLLGMTAEWTQRTALTTFTLSPRRGRVLGAKFVASIALAAAATVAAELLILGGVAVGGLISGHTADYTGLGRGLTSFLIISMLQVTMAAGFGALSAQTAVAVAAYFVAPTIYSAAGPALLGSNSDWLDVFSAFDRLSSSTPFGHAAQSATSIAFWIVLPTVVGVVRSLKREVK
ncbi:hypothetical protein SAMN04515671_1404 [Nakamurella panacisegetis]|uniref:ABC-2 family transporter protein n=1 Tax=Nakamurella panacisegetis TaxID=1090615 RepID=A0A1H0KRM2_9ACTN|nr:hypothetical protein [Nakamurella panacisegetis]SDO58433.1 hypothetical protein SAMN04515671_1404 [Nakamurella panacisegetis]